MTYACGEAGSVLEKGLRSLKIAEDLDAEHGRSVAYFALGTAYLVEGQPEAARDAFLKAVAIIRDHNTQRAFLPQMLALLSEAHLALGERTEALAAARNGIDLGNTGGCHYAEAQAQIALAATLMATDDAVLRTEIEAALARAEQLVEQIEGRALSPQILEQRARLAKACGDEPAAARLLNEALDLYRTIGATGHAVRLAKELAS